MSKIEQHWYQPKWYFSILLMPLACLFGLVSYIRRKAYQYGYKKSIKVACPVAIIGNINVGGVGKTPLTLSLLKRFATLGLEVGVVSRGYGSQTKGPHHVQISDEAKMVGDEALLMALQGARIVIGQDRVLAAQTLLKLYPNLDLILSDDGLQHYRLARDLEVVVMDAQSLIGNGHLLPNGPLREPLSRLKQVDAIVWRSTANIVPKLDVTWLEVNFTMQVTASSIYALANKNQVAKLTDLQGSIAALTAIGQPQRFFDTLRNLGLKSFTQVTFLDHYHFKSEDLELGSDWIIVTEKDATKLKDLNRGNIWVLPIEANVEPDLALWMKNRLKL